MSTMVNPYTVAIVPFEPMRDFPRVDLSEPIVGPTGKPRDPKRRARNKAARKSRKINRHK